MTLCWCQCKAQSRNHDAVEHPLLYTHLITILQYHIENLPKGKSCLLVILAYKMLQSVG